MSDKNILWGVVAGTILGAFGASLIQRGSLRPIQQKFFPTAMTSKTCS